MLGLKGRQLKNVLDDLEARDGRNLGLFEAIQNAYWGTTAGKSSCFPAWLRCFMSCIVKASNWG